MGVTMPNFHQPSQDRQHQPASSIHALLPEDTRQAWEWLQRIFVNDNRASHGNHESSDLLAGIVVYHNLQRMACESLMGFK
jgi:hypothetical protein